MSSGTSSACVAYSSLCLLIPILAFFAVDTLLYAATEHSFANILHELVSPSISSSPAKHICNCTAANQAAPASCEPKVIQIAKEIHTNCPPQKPSEPQPWYAKNRAWHYPVKFPRCTMDVCFNYTRCLNMSDLFIYVYDTPPALQYLFFFSRTRWYTRDPEKACLFFLFTETKNPYGDPAPPHPSVRAFWNGGLNHVLVSFADRWSLSHLDEASIGKASLLRTGMHSSIYRPGFDISMSFPPRHRRFDEFQSLKPWERKFFLTFRGQRYVGRPDAPGVVRSYDSFRNLHNGRDVIVAVACRHRTVQRMISANKTLGVHCEEDEKVFDQFRDYRGLMNSTFGLAPAGIQPNTYRFTEVLSAGAIPVLVVDNYVKPFDTLVQWHRCVVEFPTTETSRIVETLRQMPREELEKRQEYCLRVYRTYFSSDDAMILGIVDSFKARFMGAVPGMMPSTAL